MLRFLDLLVQYFLVLIPPTKCFSLRRSLYKLLGHQIGSDTKLCGHSWVYGRGKFEIAENSWISPNFKIYTTLSACISIGSNCDIGHQLCILTGTHAISNAERRAGDPIEHDVIIEDGVWIGARVTILPGVTIGKHSVIAAGSVVYCDVPPNTLYKSAVGKVIEKYEAID